MIVLDASVLIAFLDGDDSHHVAAEGQLAKAVDDNLGVNPLPLAEVLVAPARVGLMDATKAALRDLEVAELPFPSPVRLARLRATTGLRMPDCCVLLAAEDGATAARLRPSTIDLSKQPRHASCRSSVADRVPQSIPAQPKRQPEGARRHTAVRSRSVRGGPQPAIWASMWSITRCVRCAG